LFPTGPASQYCAYSGAYLPFEIKIFTDSMSFGYYLGGWCEGLYLA